MSLRDEFMRVLAEHGLSNDGELHGWRCHYPERYGSCTCIDELLEQLVAVVTPPLKVTVSGNAQMAPSKIGIAMSEAPATINIPPLPEGLCGFANVITGIGQCVFITNHEGKHSWEK